MINNRIDIQHFAGCLLGGAVGDALGWPIEFMSMREIQAAFGPDGLQDFVQTGGNPAEITDDTQMTLFTAEGLLCTSGRADTEDGIQSLSAAIYQAYLRWLRTQAKNSPGSGTRTESEGWLLGIPAMHAVRAPGRTCIEALRSGQMGTIEKPLNHSKGCGGVMRVAPVGLLGSHLAWSDATVFRVAAEAAAITHGHPTGSLAAGCLAVIVARIAAGAGLKEAVSASVTCLTQWPGCAECLAAIGSAVRLAQSPTITPSAAAVARLGAGWIAEEALAISLYCALVADGDFARGVLLAVNHGGDSDSTGSITGNILGVLLGQSALPGHWLDGVELHDEIISMAGNLLA